MASQQHSVVFAEPVRTAIGAFGGSLTGTLKKQLHEFFDSLDKRCFNFHVMFPEEVDFGGLYEGASSKRQAA